MNVNFTANLKRPEVEQLIREYVERAMPGHTVQSVDFKVGVHWDLRGEPSGHRLDGVDVQLKPKDAQ